MDKTIPIAVFPKSKLIEQAFNFNVYQYRANVSFRCGIILNNVRVVDTYGWVQNEKKDQIGVISMKDKEIVHIEKLKPYDDEVYTEM